MDADDLNDDILEEALSLSQEAKDQFREALAELEKYIDDDGKAAVRLATVEPKAATGTAPQEESPAETTHLVEVTTLTMDVT